MIKIVEMPSLFEGMSECKIVRWYVTPGQEIKVGDHIAEIESNKATMELEADQTGFIAKILVREGYIVPVRQTILLLADTKEGIADAAKVSVEISPFVRKYDAEAERLEESKLMNEALQRSQAEPSQIDHKTVGDFLFHVWDSFWNLIAIVVAIIVGLFLLVNLLDSCAI